MVIQATFIQQFFKIIGPQLCQLVANGKLLKRSQKTTEPPHELHHIKEILLEIGFIAKMKST